jgi:hypothetical protein
MSKRKYIFLVATLMFAMIFHAKAQVSVSRVTDPAVFEAKEGSFYYLPGTYLQVEISYDLVEKVRGPYAEYAYKFLGLDSVITVNERYYELKGIRCEAFTGPDPGQLYFVEFLQKQSKDPLELHLVFAEEGYLAEAALGMELPTQPIAVQVVKTDEQATRRQEPQASLFRYYATDNQVLKIDTIIKMVTIDTSTFKDISYKRSMIYKTMEERAAEAANAITSVREDRLKLLTGYQEVNYSQGTMEYMDSRLVEMEDAYLSLFKGSIRRESYKVSLPYFPVPEKIGQDEVICRFSSFEGLVHSGGQSGDPVMIRIEPINAPNATNIQGAGSQSPAGQGFIFRTPQMCDVTITWKDADMFNQAIPIHQLGIQNRYPSSSRFYIQLHPFDGSVRQVSVR